MSEFARIEVSGADEREGQRADHSSEIPPERDSADAETLGEAAGERHRDQRADPLRAGQRPVLITLFPRTSWLSSGHQDHRAEQRGAEAEVDKRSAGKHAVYVQTDVEQRTNDAQGVKAEEHDPHDPRERRGDPSAEPSAEPEPSSPMP